MYAIVNIAGQQFKVVKGASVSASIVGHLRGDKVIIFKKKRRKGYQKQSGHRQDLTRIQINAITA